MQGGLNYDTSILDFICKKFQKHHFESIYSMDNPSKGFRSMILIYLTLFNDTLDFLVQCIPIENDTGYVIFNQELRKIKSGLL